jgi:Uma2 family endonuclease
MATITARPVTADELLRMPDDGFRYELIHGEVNRMSPAGSLHGRIAATIAVHIGQHVRSRNLGAVFGAETGFRLATDPDHVRAPDVAFVAQQRLADTGIPDGFFPGPPDLAVEVVSPGDTFTAVEGKVADWLAHGTRLVVVADARRQRVTCYRSTTEVRLLGENDAVDGGDVVPGWSLPVRQIFE